MPAPESLLNAQRSSCVRRPSDQSDDGPSCSLLFRVISTILWSTPYAYIPSLETIHVVESDWKSFIDNMGTEWKEVVLNVRYRRRRIFSQLLTTSHLEYCTVDYQRSISGATHR